MLKWRLEMSVGKASEVIPELLKAIRQAHQDRRERKALKLNILLCLAYFADNKTPKALERLTLVLQIAGKQKFTRIILDEGATIELLLNIWMHQQETYNKYHEVPEYYLNHLKTFMKGQTQQLIQQCIFKLSKEQLRLLEGEKTSETNLDLSMMENPISRREREVLMHLSEGSPNKLIAEKMFVSETTVKAHLRNIHAKLGAKNRTEAVALARKLGVI